MKQRLLAPVSHAHEYIRGYCEALAELSRSYDLEASREIWSWADTVLLPPSMLAINGLKAH
jgi:hypothetical protein